MIFVDISVLPVTLPTIQRNLGLSELGLQWIVNAYTLVLTVLLLAGGRIADKFGHRKIFCFGLILFAGASALCGFSQSELGFVLARALQGVGGAILVPSSSAINFNAFPPHQRGKAMGLYVSLGSIFLALGPFIGGLFTQYFSWRLVFWINPPIALCGLLLTLLIVKKSEKNDVHFDLFGFFTFSVGVSSIVIALMQAKEWGWDSYLTIGMILLGLALLFFLWKYDRKVKESYIDFKLFKNRNILGSVMGIFCTQFLLMVTVFWAIYFQNALGYSPLQAGSLSFLANIPIMIAAPLGGHILDKKGPRLPIAIGFSLVAISLFWFIQNIETKNLWLILSAVIPFGFGIPFIFTPCFATALSEIPSNRRGLASGTVSTLRQLGGTLGLALIGTLFLNIQIGQLSSDLKRNVYTENIDPKKLEGLLSSAPEAMEAMQMLPEQSKAFVKQAYLNSFIDAFWWINSVAIVVALMGLFIAVSLIKKKTQPKLD